MSNARTWFKQALGWFLALVLIAVSFPLIALLVLLLRTVLLPLAALAVVTGAVVYCANNRFRCWAYRLVRGEGARSHPAT